MPHHPIYTVIYNGDNNKKEVYTADEVIGEGNNAIVYQLNKASNLPNDSLNNTINFTINTPLFGSNILKISKCNLQLSLTPSEKVAIQHDYESYKKRRYFWQKQTSRQSFIQKTTRQKLIEKIKQDWRTQTHFKDIQKEFVKEASMLAHCQKPTDYQASIPQVTYGSTEYHFITDCADTTPTENDILNTKLNINRPGIAIVSQFVEGKLLAWPSLEEEIQEREKYFGHMNCLKAYVISVFLAAFKELERHRNLKIVHGDPHLGNLLFKIINGVLTATFVDYGLSLEEGIGIFEKYNKRDSTQWLSPDRLLLTENDRYSVTVAAFRHDYYSLLYACHQYISRSAELIDNDDIEHAWLCVLSHHIIQLLQMYKPPATAPNTIDPIIDTLTILSFLSTNREKLALSIEQDYDMLNNHQSLALLNQQRQSTRTKEEAIDKVRQAIAVIRTFSQGMLTPLQCFYSAYHSEQTKDNNFHTEIMPALAQLISNNQCVRPLQEYLYSLIKTYDSNKTLYQHQSKLIAGSSKLKPTAHQVDHVLTEVANNLATICHSSTDALEAYEDQLDECLELLSSLIDQIQDIIDGNMLEEAERNKTEHTDDSCVYSNNNDTLLFFGDMDDDNEQENMIRENNPADTIVTFNKS